jgi:hypothetical protein
VRERGRRGEGVRGRKGIFIVCCDRQLMRSLALVARHTEKRTMAF